MKADRETTRTRNLRTATGLTMELPTKTENKAMNKRYKAQSLVLAFTAWLSLCFTTSCTKDVVFDEFVSLADGKWSSDSLAVFRADISDASSAYDISIMVRNDNSYAFSNLWLFIDAISPDGHSERDTLECLLATENGTWLGGGWGSLYSCRCPYKSDVKVNATGPYTFRITHGMRREDLEGIHDIGLVITKHTEDQTSK